MQLFGIRTGFFERTSNIRSTKADRIPNRVYYSVTNYSKERIVRTIRSNSALYNWILNNHLIVKQKEGLLRHQNVGSQKIYGMKTKT